MKKKISTYYWPIAMTVPLALVSLCTLLHPAPNAQAVSHSHSAANVSAEFARAISFGLVETDGNGTVATAAKNSASAA